MPHGQTVGHRHFLDDNTEEKDSPTHKVPSLRISLRSYNSRIDIDSSYTVSSLFHYFWNSQLISNDWSLFQLSGPSLINMRREYSRYHDISAEKLVYIRGSSFRECWTIILSSRVSISSVLSGSLTISKRSTLTILRKNYYVSVESWL